VLDDCCPVEMGGFEVPDMGDVSLSEPRVACKSNPVATTNAMTAASTATMATTRELFGGPGAPSGV
jgi:hypothetical protein